MAIKNGEIDKAEVIIIDSTEPVNCPVVVKDNYIQTLKKNSKYLIKIYDCTY